MIRITITTTIDQNIEKVFDRLVDMPAYTDWMPGSSLLINSSVTSDGPVGEGTTFTDRVRKGIATGEIVEFKRPERVRFRQTVYYRGIKILESRPGYELESINGKTKVHHVAEGNPLGFFKIFEPIFRVVARAERKRTVEALRRSFEN